MRSKDSRRVVIKSAGEIEIMRRAGALVRSMREELAEKTKPGMTTADLDDIFAKRVEKAGVTSAFLGLYGFPANICASINEEVVHGIPSKTRILQDGDIVSLDMGLLVDGFYTDTAVTVAVGDVDSEKSRLLETTARSLEKGIEKCVAGAYLGDIGFAVQTCAELAGFSVVKEYTGHGIGRALHEAPKVPNHGKRNCGPRLEVGWVMALEPMVNVGTWRTKTLKDDWTVVTADCKPSAHFEHTVAVTENGPEVLT